MFVDNEVSAGIQSGTIAKIVKMENDLRIIMNDGSQKSSTKIRQHHWSNN